MPLVIYKASAGSGKTFTLVKEYLKIVIVNPYDYKSVLALTFTNKATEEMKDRIISELYKLVFEFDAANPMLEQLQVELGEEFHVGKIRENGKTVLELILQNYSRFEVSTIDSLFTRILRSFSKELNLPMSYQVDLDQASAISKSVEALYQDLDHDDLLRQWFRIYAESCINNERSWNFDDDIKSLAKKLFDDKFAKLIQGQNIKLSELQELVNSLQKKIGAFENKMQSYNQICNKLFKETGFTTQDFTRGALSYFVSAIPKRDYELVPSNKLVKIATGIDDSLFTKTKLKADPSLDEQASGFHDLIKTTYQFYTEAFQDYLVHKSLLQYIYSFGILEYLNDKLRDYRDEENILLLSDHQNILRQNIQETDAPFILEKIGSQFKHILLDEFQDTSDFQWKNLLPLVTNALSEDNTVLIVGDVKQSIYRWRGGNLELLHSQVRKDLQGFYQEALDVSLQNNYRSSDHIIMFNNLFFKNAVEVLGKRNSLAEWPLLQEAYAKVEQGIPKENGRGYVQVDLLTKPNKKNGIEPLNVVIPNSIIDKINTCIADGFLYSDILILVDKNDEGVDIAQALIAANIPHLTQSSLLVKNSPKVKILIHLLRYIQQDIEILHLAELLFLLKEKESTFQINDTLFRQEIDKRSALLKAVEKELPEELTSDLLRIKQLSIPELLRELINKIPQHLSADDFTNTLIDKAVEGMAKGTVTIPAFLMWWKENVDKLQAKASSASEAVQILTVHKAKGLESPVVIYAFIQRNLNPKSELLWLPNFEHEEKVYPVLPIEYKYALKDGALKELIEEHYRFSVMDRFNTLYVAFTRPSERFYLISTLASTKETNDSSSITPSKLIVDTLSCEELLNFQNKEEKSLEFVKVYSYGKLLVNTQKEITKVEKNVEADDQMEIGTKLARNLSLEFNRDNYFKLNAQEKAYKIEIGIKAHLALERVQNEKELPSVVKQMKAEFLLDEEDAEKVSEKINQLFDQPMFQNWFDDDWQVMAERSILHQGEEYKPDRVIIKDKKATIIDYKREKDTEKYHQQLRKYENALSMMGYKDIEMYLVFVETGEIQQVEAA